MPRAIFCCSPSSHAWISPGGNRLYGPGGRMRCGGGGGGGGSIGSDGGGGARSAMISDMTWTATWCPDPASTFPPQKLMSQVSLPLHISHIHHGPTGTRPLSPVLRLHSCHTSPRPPHLLLRARIQAMHHCTLLARTCPHLQRPGRRSLCSPGGQGSPPRLGMAKGLLYPLPGKRVC